MNSARTPTTGSLEPAAQLAMVFGLLQRGDWAESERHVRAYLQTNGNSGEALYYLAFSLRSQGRWSEAADAYAKALAIDPSRGDIHDQYGAVLFELGRLAEAEAAIRRAVALTPAAANPHTNLGRVLLAQGRRAEALAAHDKALSVNPDYAQAHNNRGMALLALNRGEEARASIARAIALKPALAEAHNNLGIALHRALDFDGAVEAYRKAIALNPNYAEAHWNLSLTLLSQGRLAEGWEENRWRWQCRQFETPDRSFARPAWDGQPIPDSKLLVWGEQGVGDEILYAGMIPDLRARGVRTVVECDKRLVPLFRRSWPGMELAPRTTPPDEKTTDPGIRNQIPAGSLGRWLRPSLASFPKRRAYLQADDARRKEYRAALGGGFAVGVSWISKNPDFGAEKSAPLMDWAPILQQPDTTFVDLQYGDTAAERASVKRHLGVDVRHLPELDLFHDLDGLAALTAACDLVITVSNTTAHMAGALGVPVWVMVPDGVGQLWYWFAHRDDSVWYPSAALFRQDKPGNWGPLLDRIAANLAQFRLGRRP